MKAGTMRRIIKIRTQKRHGGQDGGVQGCGMQGNGGFTLVELIVVLVVLGILCSLAVMSIIGWQDYADFKQNNEAAKSLFTAAQIQLTQYGERGQLTALKNEITNDGKATSGYLIRDYGISDSVWRADAEGNTSQESALYFLMAESGDYGRYQKDLKGKTTAELRGLAKDESELVRYRRLKALFDLLDPYVADKSILDAAICIEFDPDPKVAQVYSVFYNQKLDGFTYVSSQAGNRTALIDADGRSEEKRREKQVGYYGAEVLSVATDNSLGRPFIRRVSLNNENTLNLSWTLGKDPQGALEGLIYTLDLYRVEEPENTEGTVEVPEKKLARIRLGNADEATLNVKDSGDGYHYIEAAYEILKSIDADGKEYWETAGKDGLMYFPINVDRAENTISLVLDAIDLDSDESSNRETLNEGTSIERLQLDAENICAYVSGSRPGVYEATRAKRSNSEHQYFGLFQNETRDGEETRVYTLLNTRQFHNIRYYEKHHPVTGSGAPNIEYRLLTDLDWTVTLNSGTVYRGLNPIVPEKLGLYPEDELTKANFKPILNLGARSKLMTTESGSAHTLKNFNLFLENVPTVTEGSRIPQNTVGLFVLNEGWIENLTFDAVEVSGIGSGEDGAAGAFCGLNRGKLSRLTVKSGSVSGDSCVGGIAGAMDTNHLPTIPGASQDAVTVDSLINRATVTGNLYVGGVAGKVLATDRDIRIADSANYGAVAGLNDAYYIGGIAGYTEAVKGAGTAPALSVESCTSSPASGTGGNYDILRAIEEGSPENVDYTQLNGIYVGGIVGLNKGASIENCDTLRETGNEKGYIIGKKYVGGIVGFNEGNAGIVGGEGGRNQALVFGYDYVGGIVGCNAKGTWVPDSREVQISGKGSAEPYVSNWINEGEVFAVGNYAGGITGFNYGTILGCNSNVEYTSVLKNVTQAAANAQYVGGIAGYNAGRIDGKLTPADAGVMSAVSAVIGHHFVGGIAGYNDVGGQIHNYELMGGYIHGSKFVGGLIGLNADASVFENRIYCNPNEIVGDYFVGGIIGANIVPTGSDITAQFKADNFLGSLRATRGAFAGGFIGYNYLLKEGTDISLIREGTEFLCSSDRFPTITEQDTLEEISKKLQDLEAPLKNLLAGYANSENKMTITGEALEVSFDDTQVRLGGVKALVYVGGVIGYNQATTKLEVKNVENITPVEATAYIVREESGVVARSDGNADTIITIGLDLEGNEKRYAYAGGIIGRVTQNVTLNNCKNRDIGEVRSTGTYTGGLAEINEGTITDCMAGSLGDGTQDYIGGLVGVNLGTVENCTVAGTIMGKSRIGGLVSENYGIIRNPMVGTDAEGCYIETTGQAVGGIAGYGFKDSQIIWNQDAQIDISISSSGSYAGGAIGINEGSVLVAKAGSDTASDQLLIKNKEGNSIIGRNYVGGFIGMQKGRASLNYMHNYATVQAEQGFAGGITAWISSGAVSDAADGSIIQNCINYGTVSVLSENDGEDDVELFPDGGQETGDGDRVDNEEDDNDLHASAAGGIIAVNYGVISQCVDYGTVDGGNGYGGGIAGLNYGKITRSRVGGANTVEMSGNQYVGGIAAKNKTDAVIENSAVYRATIQNQTFTADGYMGGIAGENQGRIENCSVGVGWDAEKNTGADKDYDEWHKDATVAVMMAINAVDDKSRTIDSAYSLENVEDAENAVILTSNAADVSIGGVVGINSLPEDVDSKTEKENGVILGIEKDKDGNQIYTVVLAEMGFVEHSMNYYGNLGGVAGINQGTIENYEFNGFVHGSANDPSHTPEYSPNYDYEQGNNPIYGYGGIAGINGDDEGADDAKISHCLVNMARVNGSGSATNRSNVGGVAGVNGTDAEIRHILYGNQADLSEMTGDIKKFFVSAINNKTYEGTVWIGTDAKSANQQRSSVGHVGGVAGYNQGTVAYINIEKDKKSGVDDEKKDEKKDGSAVIVHSTGHTGGIVGYNRRMGSVHHVVTDPDWLVGAEEQEQDNGTGGIIGYNISERNVEFCDNHASVIKKIGNSVGGIVGRNEIATSNSWRFYNCRNYGTIDAASRGAGIIGQWKYKGGTLESCVNYGKITASSEACGGIVGMLYGLDAKEVVNLVDCRNHGDIGSEYVNIPTAGIFAIARAAGSSGLTANLYNCVNTGLIGGNGSDSSAGIIAQSWSMKTNLYYCRNYGYGMKGKNANFGGIYGINSNVTMKDCFGITDREASGWPITNKESASRVGGYYFAGAELGESSADGAYFYVKKIEATSEKGKIDTGKNIGYVISEDSTDSNTYFKGTSDSDRGCYSIEFDKPVDLNKISLAWFRNASSPEDTNFRFYEYKIDLYNEQNDLSQIEVDEREDYETNIKAPNGIYELDSKTEGKGIYRIVIGDIMASPKNNSKNAALAKFSATAMFNDVEVGISTFPYTDGKNTEASNNRACYERSDTLMPPPASEQLKEDVKYGTPLYVLKEGDSYQASNIASDVMIEDLGSNSLDTLLLRDNTSDRAKDSALAYKLYDEADRYFVLKNNTGTLKAPVVSPGKAMGGYYRVSWSGDIQSQFYDVEYQYYAKDSEGNLTVALGEKDENGNMIPNKYRVYTSAVDILSEYTYGGIRADGVKVRVQAGVKTGTGGEIRSDWSDDSPTSFGVTLPAPLVHWELVTLGNVNCYRIVLDNKTEYEELKKNYTDLDLSKIKVKTWLQPGIAENTALEFTVEDGALLSDNGYELKSGYDSNNRYLVAYASMADSTWNFDQSAKTIREAQLPSKDVYVSGTGDGGTVMADAKLEPSDTTGFFGDTMSSLNYQTTLVTKDNWVVNYRTEMIATKQELGIPIAYAVSPFTRTSPDGTKTNQIVLNGLPDDFLNQGSEAGSYLYDQVSVRMYPTKMSNDIFYQGWQVRLPGETTTMSLEELGKLKVTESGQVDMDEGTSLIQGSGGKKSLMPGYVIEYAGVNEYTLYYNTLLREMMKASEDGTHHEEDWKYKYNNSAATYRYQQVIYHEVDMEAEITKKGMQPTPIAYVNAEPVSSPEGIIWKDGDYQSNSTFTLTWDQKYVDDSHPAYGTAENQYKIGAKYLLSVEGISKEISADGQETEQVTPLATNLSFETKAEEGYNSWTANSSNWVYDLVRVTLTRLGETGKDGITSRFPATYIGEYKLKKRLATIGRPSITNKVVDGEVQKDGLKYVISWTGIDKMNLSEEEKERQKKNFQYYKVEITGKKSNTVYQGYMKENDITDSILEVDFSDPVVSEEGIASYFYQGEKIAITVTSIAKENSETYRSGLTSAVLETDIPIRLEAPDMGMDDNPSSNMTANIPELLDAEAFLDGCITLHMKTERGVKYQIALQVFEDKAAAEKGDSPIAEIQGLPEKSDEKRVYMTEQLNDCIFTVSGIPAEYAGKYLKVVLRAVSENSISSLWTDEDQDMEYWDGTTTVTHSKVPPYRLFVLPSVKIEPVTLEEPLKTERLDYPLLKNGVADSTYMVSAKQQAMTFTTTEYADGYRIQVIQTPQAAERTATPSDANMVVSDVIQMTLVREESGDGYLLEYESSELADNVTDQGDDGTAESQTFSIPLGADVVLPYKKLIPITDDGVDSYALLVESQLRAELVDGTDRVKFTFVLPDVEKIEDDLGEEVSLPNVDMNYTEQVLIQSIAEGNLDSDPETDNKFHDSDWAFAARVGSALRVIPDPIPTPLMAEDGSDEPASGAGLDGAKVQESERKGFAYELEEDFRGKTRYLVQVTDEGGNVLGIYGVPFNKQTSVSVYDENVWFPLELASDAERTVTLNFSSIYAVNGDSETGYQGGGRSAFSETGYQVKLPSVQPVAGVLIEQYTSEPIVCDTSVQGRTSEAVVRKVTAKQTQMEWFYDYEDTKVVGYDLTIRGLEGASDYYLELDLQQNEFGRFAGLSEYMTPEGKVLYSVGYDLQGDMVFFAGNAGEATPSDATPSDAAPPNATPSNAGGNQATASNADYLLEHPGILVLNCSLRVEQQKKGLKFVLTLPDAAIGQLKGSAAEEYQQSEYYYDGGLYHTDQISVQPVVQNPYYALPEQEWAAILRSYREEEEEAGQEADSSDGMLRNDLK